MNIIRRMRRQKAVWWERGTPNEYGEFDYAGPLEIDCRWDDSAQEFRNTRGEKALSEAVVYVDRLMKIGDQLRKGEMESDTPVSPIGEQDTFEIQGFDQTPTLKADKTLFTAHLWRTLRL